MEKISLLTENQVKKLDILKKYGMTAKVTDLYILYNEPINENKEGHYWTKTTVYHTAIDEVYYVNAYGFISSDHIKKTCGVRPVISLFEIEKNYSKEKTIYETLEETEEIEYGEYPQSVVDEETELELENLYQKNILPKTQKKYTFLDDTNIYDEVYQRIFQIKNKDVKRYKTYEEYRYKENKYIRFDMSKDVEEEIYFKNGRKAQDNQIYWIKVEPIKWLVDEKERIAISKYILTKMEFSFETIGLPNYEYSIIKEYLEKYFIKEIIPSTNIDIKKIDELIDLMSNVKEKPKQKVK